MAYDGLTMAAITHELREWLEARVEKVYQPEATTLVLLLHQAKKGKVRLLLSVNPSSQRIHLTTEKLDNPATPPMFCMLLRKYLEGSRLTAVLQAGMERILSLSFSGKDELGNLATFRLVGELMGRHSNIMLLSPDNKIIDAIVRVPPAMSTVRMILPGITYSAPEHQDRKDTLELSSSSDLRSALAKSIKQEVRLNKLLVQSLTGISPLLARELLFRAGLQNPTGEELSQTDWESLWREVHGLQQMVREGSFSPSLADQQFAALPLKHLASKPWDGSMNELLDQLMHRANKEKGLEKAKVSLLQAVRQQLQKNERKLGYLTTELAELKDDLSVREVGELLLSNLHLVKPKVESVELVNYYDPELRPLTVELDPRLNATQNAQRYFRRYERAKNGLPMVERNIAKTDELIKYLVSVQDSLERADSLSLVDEVRQELQQAGILPSEKKPKKIVLAPSSETLRFRVADGWEILVGRNNLQNERLTKAAASEDWWLHAKDIPGSHVIIKGLKGEPPIEVLLQAAQIAAFYSKARQASKVPVDYTQRKYVRKPGGSPPGFVIYTDQKTLMVEPKLPIQQEQ